MDSELETTSSSSTAANAPFRSRGHGARRSMIQWAPCRGGTAGDRAGATAGSARTRSRRARPGSRPSGVGAAPRRRRTDRRPRRSGLRARPGRPAPSSGPRPTRRAGCHGRASAKYASDTAALVCSARPATRTWRPRAIQREAQGHLRVGVDLARLLAAVVREEREGAVRRCRGAARGVTTRRPTASTVDTTMASGSATGACCALECQRANWTKGSGSTSCSCSPTRLELGPLGCEVGTGRDGALGHDTLNLTMVDTASSADDTEHHADHDRDDRAHRRVRGHPPEHAVQADAAVQQGRHDERAVEEPPHAVVPPVDVERHAEVTRVVEHPRATARGSAAAPPAARTSPA